MKNSFLSVVILIVAAFVGSAVSKNVKSEINPANIEPSAIVQDWIPCTVSDPTGTPLNVRAKPNGKIIAKLKNDTLVAIDDSTAGKKWSRISFEKSGKWVKGWVLREYLSCQ